MTYFAAPDSDAHKQSSVVVRDGWATCLGIACLIALVGFGVLGVGIAIGAAWAYTTGFVLLALAGVVAALSGFMYFAFERYDR